MATTYRFQISMPVTDVMPRNRITNVLHFEHVTGGIGDSVLEDIASDLVALYQTRYGDSAKEIQCKAYDVDAKPNYPRADVIVNSGVAWSQGTPREIALVLSFAGEHRGNKSERGRIYLNPAMVGGGSPMLLRPSQAQLDWALLFYTSPNGSFPDIGGIDWKFGVYSRTYKTFKQSSQAWVNDEWDVQRRRGLRETTRVQALREG